MSGEREIDDQIRTLTCLSTLGEGRDVCDGESLECFFRVRETAVVAERRRVKAGRATRVV